MSILVYHWKHGQMAHSYAWKADGDPIVEVRIYRKNVLDFQRPESLICVSGIPLAAAREAAPILN